MNGTDSEQPEITADRAVREVLKIERRTESLLQRVVGLTWMLWAVINGGIFVTYEAISLAAPTGAIGLLAYILAWLPWVILGAVATTVLWRSLAIAAPPSPIGTRWVTIAATATFLVLILGGLAVVALAKLPVNEAAWAMFAVGLATAVVGGSGFTTLSRSERVFWLVGGVGLAVVAVGVGALAGHLNYDAGDLFLVLGPVASTSVLFGGGLYTGSR